MKISKKLLSIMLCCALLLSIFPPFVIAETISEDVVAECTFDTYYELSSDNSVRTYDDAKTLFCGLVYDRYAKIKFDISAFEGKEFGGSVLSLYIRNLSDNNTLSFYGSVDGTEKNAELITTYNTKTKAKINVRVSITDYIKAALDTNIKEVTFFVTSSANTTSIFSTESSDKSVRPCLFICKEEPFIIGQFTFKYPEISQTTFKSDLQKVASEGHPYLFAGKDDFENIRENAFGKNKYLTEMYSELKKQASTYIGKDPTNVDAVINNQAYNSRAAECLKVITSCAFVYMIEGDESYAQRAYNEAKIFADLKSWGTVAYIDNNFPVLGLAVCYDWMYDWLGDVRRNELLNALKSNHFDTIYDLFANPSKYTSAFYRSYFGADNFTLLLNTATFLGAMVMDDYDADYAAFIMQNCFKNLKKVVENWYPDSAWYEGLGYWGYTGEFMAMWLLGMRNTLGTCYGIEDIECMRTLCGSPIYGSSSNYAFLANDMPYETARPTKRTYILSTFSGEPSLEKYALLNDTTPDALKCIAFKTDTDYDSISVSEFSLDKHFRNTDLVTMRNTWEGNQEIFCGMFVQDAKKSHATMKSGTLALEAFGDQWITNPGSDSYSLEGYWENGQNGKRWRYYFSRPEANSCLVINPGTEGGQIIDSGDVIDKFVSKPKGAYAVSDLTKTYKKYAQSYKRGVMLTDERTKFVVQDEVKLFTDQEVYSFININKCDSAEVTDDKKSVILTKNNKKVMVRILCDTDFELSIMSAEPLPSSPQMENNKIIRDIKRIAVHFPSVSEFNMRYEFIPYLTDIELNSLASEITPIAEWSVPDGELEVIKAESISLDGKVYEEFNPANRVYTLEQLPQKIECTADSSKYEISITENEAETAKYVVLKDKNSGRYFSYMFELPDKSKEAKVINVSNYKKLNIVNIFASTHSEDAVPENAIDGDITTRWAANGRQSITFELEKETSVHCIAIAFYSGNARKAYFDMEVSTDGKNWVPVSVNDSSGTTTDFEYFDMKDIKAKYVRYKGLGNSSSTWNSLNEVVIYGK